MAGRPSIYTDELANKICDKIATSSIGLIHICKELNISYRTVNQWIYNNNHEFHKKYARAKERQADHMAQEILDIADDGRNDLMTVVYGDKEYEQENKEVLNRSRLRVDARKWLMSKILPKKYGDKLELSGDAANPLQVITGMRIVDIIEEVKPKEIEEAKIEEWK